jgi:hypothetical protein
LRERNSFEYNKAKIAVSAFSFGDKIGGKVSVWTLRDQVKEPAVLLSRISLLSQMQTGIDALV